MVFAIPIKKRWFILFYHEQGIPKNVIQRTLQVSRRTVDRWLARFAERDDMKTNYKGRKGYKCTTDEEDELIGTTCINDPWKSASQIYRELRNAPENPLQCSYKTVNNRLNSFGLKSYRAAKKPRQHPGDAEKRLLFCERFLRFPFWDKIIMVDECVFVSQGKSTFLVRRPRGTRYDENFIKNIEEQWRHHYYGFALATINGPGPLIKIESRFNQTSLQLMLNQLKPFVNECIEQGIVWWLWDNHRVHYARSVMDYWNSNVPYCDLFMISIPPRSPDTNGIENLFGYLKNHKLNIEFRNQLHFVNKIEEEWRNIPPQFCRNIVNSMPHRICAIKQNEGRLTKY